MSPITARLWIYLLLLTCAVSVLAQQPAATPNGTNVLVPPLVNFSGVLTDVNGKPLTSVVGVTFALYNSAHGGSPLWLETQNVYPDKTGHYTVVLGSTTSQGLPSTLFASGEARWLGVQPQAQGQTEQPRVMLLAVPYALKAIDAETLGGMPASAFVQTNNGRGIATPAAASELKNGKVQPDATTITGSGTTNYLPLWTSSSTLGNSLLFQSGSNLGVGTTSPSTKLEVNKGTTAGGGISVDGSNDTRVKIGVGQPTVWSWSNGWITPGDFSLVEEGKSGSRIYVKPGGNVGIGTTAPSSTLEVNKGTTAGGGIYLDGSNDTRVKIGVGQPTVWSWSNGWTTPGDFSLIEEGKSGSRIYFKPGGNVGIGTSTPAYALDVNGTANFSGAVNFASGSTFNGNQTVNGNLSATGWVTGAGFNIGSNIFGWGSATNYNAFVGYAGNPGMTGLFNTGNGWNALANNQSGEGNTATGANALIANSTGGSNTANGFQALAHSSVASSNVAVGASALYTNVGDSLGDGWYNTAVGAGALFANNETSGTTNNARENTAVGYNALYGSTIGSFNIGVGSNAGAMLTTGSYNTFVGVVAGDNPVTGNGNTAIGYEAGFNLTSGATNVAIGSGAGLSITSGSNNIDIANAGVTSDSGVIRIGAASTQTAAYIAGIYNANAGGNVVYITSNGQLSSYSSSRRYKQDIRDIGDTTRLLMRLRPVTFRYKSQGQNGPQQYGLIAEEVQEVAPDLVGRDRDGRIDSVHYDKLNILLLKQVQKQHRMIAIQKRQFQSQIREQQQQIRAQQAQIVALISQVKAIQASLNTSRRNDADVRTVSAEVSVVHQ